jgi:hypothetical protein
MDRKRQIELMTSAEVRTEGYFRTWMQNPQFKAAIRRTRRTAENGAPQPLVRQKKCAGV